MNQPVLSWHNLKSDQQVTPDFKLLSDWDREFFPWPWDEQDWLNIENSHSHFLVSWIDSTGFSLWQLDNAPNAYLLKILSVAGKKRCGAGSLLMQQSLGRLRELGFESACLEVQVDNIPAISLYLKSSWQKSHIIKGFYSDGCDALSMSINL
ncbi:MAG: GNAT family N-acetyltransferase [bacterium]